MSSLLADIVTEVFVGTDASRGGYYLQKGWGAFGYSVNGRRSAATYWMYRLQDVAHLICSSVCFSYRTMLWWDKTELTAGTSCQEIWMSGEGYLVKVRPPWRICPSLLRTGAGTWVYRKHVSIWHPSSGQSPVPIILFLPVMFPWHKTIRAEY